MREDDARELDHQTLEQIRVGAVKQIENGAQPEDIAVGLGMQRSKVYGLGRAIPRRWCGGVGSQAHSGRPLKLSGTQLRRLYAMIVGSNPRQLQFGLALWTRDTVRQVIRAEFGVRLSAVAVGRLPRELGLSPRRPPHQAYQQNPAAVAAWKAEQYPEIHAEAKTRAVKDYVASTSRQLRLFFLPPYSPERDPDE